MPGTGSRTGKGLCHRSGVWSVVECSGVAECLSLAWQWASAALAGMRGRDAVLRAWPAIGCWLWAHFWASQAVSGVLWVLWLLCCAIAYVSLPFTQTVSATLNMSINLLTQTGVRDETDCQWLLTDWWLLSLADLTIDTDLTRPAGPHRPPDCVTTGLCSDWLTVLWLTDTLTVTVTVTVTDRTGLCDAWPLGRARHVGCVLTTSMDDSPHSHSLSIMHAVSQQMSAHVVPPAPHPYGLPDPTAGTGNSEAPVGTDQRKHDISEILQQIMNITDQSLDEAQARSVLSANNRFLLHFLFVWPSVDMSYV